MTITTTRATASRPGSGREPAALARLAEAFAGVEVVVVGDSVLDGWLSGRPRGLSREGPVPVITVAEQVEAPGAAANTAVALAALGAHAQLLSVVGDDADGATLRRLLRGHGVDDAGIRTERGRATVSKRRIASGGHLHVRCDTGDDGPPRPATVRALLGRLEARRPGADAVLVCDYDGGLFADPAARRLLAAPRRAGGALLAVDAHQPARWARARPDVVTPNLAEVVPLLPAAAAEHLRRRPADRLDVVAGEAAAVLRACGARAVAVTLDRDGVLLLEPGRQPRHLPGVPAPDEQTIGAGDTFAATLTLGLAAGGGLVEAAELACAAAAVVVGRPGTTVCTARQLRARLDGERPRVLETAELARAVAAHRDAGRTVAFTNGCFDVLHRGHVAYLTAAAGLADVLVVGVNSDASVRRQKGPDRPVNDVADRLAVLSALTCVDHLAVFDGDTPHDLLRAVRPDVYVKGGDYTEAMLPEAPLVRALGGEVRIVDYVEDHSTTGLIGRIRNGETGR